MQTFGPRAVCVYQGVLVQHQVVEPGATALLAVDARHADKALGFDQYFRFPKKHRSAPFCEEQALMRGDFERDVVGQSPLRDDDGLQIAGGAAIGPTAPTDWQDAVVTCVELHAGVDLLNRAEAIGGQDHGVFGKPCDGRCLFAVFGKGIAVGGDQWRAAIGVVRVQDLGRLGQGIKVMYHGSHRAGHCIV